VVGYQYIGKQQECEGRVYQTKLYSLLAGALCNQDVAMTFAFRGTLSSHRDSRELAGVHRFGVL
jgi:hypothetical protein